MWQIVVRARFLLFIHLCLSPHIPAYLCSGVVNAEMLVVHKCEMYPCFSPQTTLKSGETFSSSNEVFCPVLLTCFASDIKESFVTC